MQRSYNHWKITFNNYVASATTADDANLDQTKLHALFNHVSASIFDLNQ